MTKTAILTGKTKDSYLALVNGHPLVSIKNDAQLEAASKMVDWLLQRGELNSGEEAYLEALGDLIARYEDEHYPMAPASGADLLAHLMDSKGVSQAELANETGIPRSTVSEILSGKRSFSKANIPRLAAYFHVEPAVFLRAANP